MMVIWELFWHRDLTSVYCDDDNPSHVSQEGDGGGGEGGWGRKAIAYSTPPRDMGKEWVLDHP